MQVILLALFLERQITAVSLIIHLESLFLETMTPASLILHLESLFLEAITPVSMVLRLELLFLETNDPFNMLELASSSSLNLHCRVSSF